MMTMTALLTIRTTVRSNQIRTSVILITMVLATSVITIDRRFRLASLFPQSTADVCCGQDRLNTVEGAATGAPPLLLVRPSVNHYSDSYAEIVLCAVKQSRGVVVNLNNPDINSIACTNIDTTSKGTCKPGFGFCEILRTWAGKDGDTSPIGDVYAIASIRSAHKRMSEWLEGRLRRIVFDLNTSQKVKEARIDVNGIRDCTNRNCAALEVSRKIKLEPEVSREISCN